MLPLLVLTALLATGLAFAVLGVRRYGRSRRWPRTTGTVTGSRMGTSSATRDGGAIAPTVRYAVEGGRVLEVASSVSDDLGSYQSGRELPVRYDPQDPERMVVDTAAQNGLVMALLGLVLTGVGGFGLLAVALTR